MAPKAKPKAKGKKKEVAAPTRIKNARELRAEYSAIANSAEGMDKDPSTMPKVVECKHCGWPVWPRECKVATKKCFERAGIVYDLDAKMKEREAKKTAGEGDLDLGEEEEEGGDDEESEDELVLLQSQIDELNEKVDELTATVSGLEKENEELKKEIEDLNESLADKEERIELLEESEKRWREKNSLLRIENEEHKLYISRLGSRVGHLESDMCAKLMIIKELRETLAKFVRRRNLMLEGLEKKMYRMEAMGVVAALFGVWNQELVQEKKKRETQDMELRRRVEVSDLNDQLGQEKERVSSLRATTTRLRGSLKAAAQRMLMKVMSATQKPWADGHALRAWCGAHATMKVENELIRTTHSVEELKAKYGAEQEKTEQLAGDLGEVMDDLNTVSKERDDLAGNLESLSAELSRLTGNMGKEAEAIKRAAAEKARKAKEELERQLRAECAKEIAAMRDDFKEQKLSLEDEIETLKATIESIKRGVGGANAGGSAEEEQNRVVPKGQGVMCVGCLTQIVNRGMKQLPPVTNTKNKVTLPAAEDAARRTFFQEELLGMPDPDDLFHTEFWKMRRDPMNGLKYAGVSADSQPWPTSTRSASTGKLMPLNTKAMKTEKIFKPRAFR